MARMPEAIQVRIDYEFALNMAPNTLKQTEIHLRAAVADLTRALDSIEALRDHIEVIRQQNGKDQ